MNKTFLASAFGLAASGLLSAQGLYNIMPFDDEPSDSLPLNWTAGASLGWDSNPAPQFTECDGVDSDDVVYMSAFVQANFVSKTPQTTIDLWGRAGATYYLDEIPQITGTEDFFPQLRGGVNFVHRVNETLRLRSRNHVTLEQEPDYDFGIATDRRQGSYLRYSSDNSVGYRWTERLGTNTGYRLSGVTFDEVDRNDYVRHLFYNQFRYRTSPSTVWTAAYRNQDQSNDSSRDSNSHYFLVGAEHEVSPTTVVVLRAGAQIQKIDGGASNSSPYVEATVRAALTESVQVRAFARYGLEDRSRWVSTQDCGSMPQASRYEERQTFRLGLQGSYVVSPKLTFFGGVNVMTFAYDGLENSGGWGVAPGSLDERVVNFNAGASYEVADNIFVTGSYNYTKSSSDADIRDYDRNRVQIGLQSSF
jgi:hypothetical protein